MKRYLLVLTSLFVIFVVSISVALASVGLPPSDPQDNPPGIEISPEERRHSDCVKACEDHYKQQVESCPNPGDPFGGNAYSNCVKTAQNTLQGCFRMCEEMRNPPTLILPNGGSPGEPAQEPPCVEIPRPERIAGDEIERYLNEVYRPCMKRAETPSERERCLEAWRVFQEGIRHYLEENRGFGPKCPIDDSSEQNNTLPNDGLGVIPASAQEAQEEMAITTYYPAPYGEYSAIGTLGLTSPDVAGFGDKLIVACPAGEDKLTSLVFLDKEGKPLYSIGYSEGKVESLSIFHNYPADDPATDQDESSVIEAAKKMDTGNDLHELELKMHYVDDVCSDTDTDAVIDGLDNCPFIANPDQSDSDTDGLGDVCDNCPEDPDNDADQDGICGDVDSCPLENPLGLDADSDGCTDTIDGLYEHLRNTEIQAGVKNSLLSKVSSASDALTRGSVTAAINQLGAFTNQVAAQAGKKISWEDTAVLASFAQNIGWTIDPNPPFPDKRAFCPDGPWDKNNPPVLTDLYLCQSGCRTDYMNTPDNPAYHRTQTFLDCMDDCYRRFGPSCEPEPDATPDSRR